MPSSKVRDDLPNHSRGWLVKLLAETVIAGVSRRRNSGTAPRTPSQPTTTSTADADFVEAEVVEETKRSAQRSLPASPIRSATGSLFEAQQVRERLKRHNSRSR